MVTNAVSSFRDGQFKQKLSITRIPGQIDAGGGNIVENKPADNIETSPDAKDMTSTLSLPSGASFNLPSVPTFADATSVINKFSQQNRVTNNLVG